MEKAMKSEASIQVVLSKDVVDNVKAKIVPFTKIGDKIAVTKDVPTELISQLQEENMTVFYGGTYYSFIYYKNDEKSAKIISKISKATSSLPIGKDGEYTVGVFVDDLNINIKHLFANVEVAMTPNWTAKSKVEKRASVKIYIVKNANVENEVKQGKALADALVLTKRLVEMPANYLTPKKFYEEAQAVAEKLNNALGEKKVQVTAIVGNNLQVGGYGSMYAVSKGSVEDAHLITLEYKGSQENEKPLVLVGKGITFDTGGISLKPAATMARMKGDMAGAATALASFYYACLMDINVVAILACAENMPDGNAVKPGDIIKAKNGKTIEVDNTDAEGRLVLADALCLAQTFEGHTTIDFATLTGACITALGHIHTGLFSDDESLVAELRSIGNECGDTVWHLPMGDEYKDMLKSEVADMVNLNRTMGAGATGGAIFLKEFAPSKRWVHMDIAGTSEVKSATGRPVPLISNFIDSLKTK